MNSAETPTELLCHFTWENYLYTTFNGLRSLAHRRISIHVCILVCRLISFAIPNRITQPLKIVHVLQIHRRQLVYRL